MMNRQTQSDILNAYTAISAATQLIERELIQLHPRPVMLEHWREVRAGAEARLLVMIRGCLDTQALV